MNNKSTERLLRTLGNEFGIKRILFALPQQEVKRVLGLKSVGELASDIGMNYGSFQSRVERGTFPYPEIQLRRRAYYSPDQARIIASMIEAERRNKSLTFKPKSG